MSPTVIACKRPNVPHRTRPELVQRHPVQVTLRAVRRAPSMREQVLFRVLTNVFRQANTEDFRVVHFSVQADHIHLIVEAMTKRQLSSRLRSIIIRIAKRLNALLSRRGPLWGDRYHRRDLKSPREVRNSLVYVLFNFRKHLPASNCPVVDPCSSASWFDGWSVRPLLPPEDETKPPVAPAETWLLSVGWARYLGPIHPRESDVPAF